jgi:hypothetical protein
MQECYEHDIKCHFCCHRCTTLHTALCTIHKSYIRSAHDHLPIQPDPALAVNGSEANVVIKLAPNDLKSAN